MPKLKNTPPMSNSFDSYVKDGAIIIVTASYEGGEKVVTLNHVSLARAKEIAKDLQDSINSLEKSTT